MSDKSDAWYAGWGRGLSDTLKTRGLGPFGFRRCEVGRHPHLWNTGTAWPAVFRHLHKDMDVRRHMAAQSPLQTCPAHSKDKSHAVTVYEGRDGRVSVKGVEIPRFKLSEKRILQVYVWREYFKAFVLMYFPAGTEPPHLTCANCNIGYTRRPDRGCNRCGYTGHLIPPKDGDGA